MTGTTETTLAGLPLEHPVFNAAGTAKTVDEVARLARSAVAAVTVGSITLAAREGNVGEVFTARDGYAINALGLPNRGADFYRDELPKMAELTRTAGKPLIVSVAGFSPDEYGDLTALSASSGADLVELNLGCPNVWNDGSQHRIASFDPDLVARSVSAAIAAADGVPVGAKVSPLSDPTLLAEIAAVLADSGVRFVVSCNTFPNGLALRPDGRSAIDVEYGGVSGGTMKPIALGQVGQLRRLLPPEIDLVGTGGVRRGTDIDDFRHAGAVAVGAATLFWTSGEDPRCFGDLLADWVA